MSPLTTDHVALADSPFLHPPPEIQPHKRTIVHLTRDLIQPLVVLPHESSADTSAAAETSNQEPAAVDSNAETPAEQPTATSETDTAAPPAEEEESAEQPSKPSKKSKKRSRGANGRNGNANEDGGPVYTTRFGNFPHSSLLGLPLGSQVRSSTNHGFIHVLNPTPELWTTSLPHRTQVVYTPDSSYILHRLRVRPGSRLIEAGAGSGSFTHAAVRAAYDGLPQGTQKKGKVFSFEFHSDRVDALRKELTRHGLDGLVEVIGRDVCQDGFDTVIAGEDAKDAEYVDANAVFLDLPAPWLAVPHLKRRCRRMHKRGPLSPNRPVHMCVFSPCLEQSLKTIKVMREIGWAEIDLVEIQHKRLEVRRVGPHGREITGKPSRHREEEEASNPASLAEAVSNLKDVLEYRKKAQAAQAAKARNEAVGDDFFGEYAKFRGNANGNTGGDPEAEMDDEEILEARQKMLHAGRVITRPEPDLKTHTSYLVFAVLPIEWTAEDEAEAAKKYPSVRNDDDSDATPGKKQEKMKPVEGSKRSQKKELKRRRIEEEAAKKEGTDQAEGKDGEDEQKNTEEVQEDDTVDMIDVDDLV